ncbi:hypothetical protein QTN25_005669 [Entamoeba marina]
MEDDLLAFFDHSDDENDNEFQDCSDNDSMENENELSDNSNQYIIEEEEINFNEHVETLSQTEETIINSNHNTNHNEGYNFGNFGFVEDGIKDSCKRNVLNQRKWNFSEGTLVDCDVRRYVKDCEKTEFNQELQLQTQKLQHQQLQIQHLQQQLQQLQVQQQQLQQLQQLQIQHQQSKLQKEDEFNKLQEKLEGIEKTLQEIKNRRETNPFNVMFFKKKTITSDYIITVNNQAAGYIKKYKLTVQEWMGFLDDINDYKRVKKELAVKTNIYRNLSFKTKQYGDKGYGDKI